MIGGCPALVKTGGEGARGLQVQADLQEAHLAGGAPHRFPWGALAALCLVLVGGFVLWTFWWQS